MICHPGRWLDRMLQDFPENGEVREQTQVLIVILLVLSGGVGLPFLLFTLMNSHLTGMVSPILLNLLLVLLGPALIWITRITHSPLIAVHTMCAFGVFGVTASVIPYGSSSVLPVWYVVLVVLAAMTGGMRTAIFWCSTALLSVWGIGVYDWLQPAMEPNLPVLLNLTLVILLTTMAMAWWETVRAKGRRSAAALQDVERRTMLLERLSTVGTLATGMAHELNTPLTYVLLNLESLSDSVDNPEDQEIISETVEGALRMKEIVQQIKTFANANQEETTLRPIPLAPIVTAAQTMLVSQLRQVGEVLVDVSESMIVSGNSGQLCQVCVNLIQNAIAVLPQEGSRIHVVARATEDTVTLSVIDNGPGVPEHLRERIFDPFFTTKAIGEGTGLGLSISSSILRGLSGTLTVHDTSPGTGAEFRITLPRSQAIALTPTGRDTEAANRSLRLLIVDDDPLLGKAAHRALGAEHDVDFVVSGAEACARLEQDSTYDAIVCDVMMPRMAGWEFKAIVEQRFPTLEPHMIFISGGAITGEAEVFLESIQDRFLQKPFSMDELKQRVLEYARPSEAQGMPGLENKGERTKQDIGRNGG